MLNSLGVMSHMIWLHYFKSYIAIRINKGNIVWTYCKLKSVSNKTYLIYDWIKKKVTSCVYIYEPVLPTTEADLHMVFILS